MSVCGSIYVCTNRRSLFYYLCIAEVDGKWTNQREGVGKVMRYRTFRSSVTVLLVLRGVR